jgi:hypothetical protein
MPRGVGARELTKSSELHVPGALCAKLNNKRSCYGDGRVY